MKPDVSDKLTTILRGTQDGDLLHEFDLKLVENAANGNLTDLGVGEIDTMQQLVQSGEYDASKRWLECIICAEYAKNGKAIEVSRRACIESRISDVAFIVAATVGTVLYEEAQKR